ncbi:unnamed protein product [Schistocephalus solidus]|uniref:Protein SET n=1 Tax=Schistocephalus solidus TaxID=70667 RepID=A0A183SMX6_SCHSO|nr:unnamed protein product [Schistocephalus solidus]
MAAQPKISRTENDNAEAVADLDHEILESVDAVQEAIDSLNKQASAEILRVEQKFNVLRKPHYKQRAELLAKIPNFWLTVFINHVQIRKLVTEEDEKVLAYLKAVEVQEFDDITSGYKIHFVRTPLHFNFPLQYFNKNDYFKNEVITKEYRVGEKGEPTATSSKIEWFPNKDLTEMKDNGSEEQKRPFPQQPSFFCWFSDDWDASGDVIGESIKDELWPNPLQFYLNPDLDSDDVEDDILDEDDEDEDEEDDEDANELGYEEDREDVPKSS